MGYGKSVKYRSYGGTSGRSSAAIAIQRSRRAQTQARSRAPPVNSVQNALLRLSETQCLRRYYHAMIRINQPTAIPAMLWMANRSLHSGILNYGFHDCRQEVAIRKSQEVYSSSLRFNVHLTGNEGVSRIAGKMMVVEYKPTERITNKLHTGFSYNPVAPLNDQQSDYDHAFAQRERKNSRYWSCKDNGNDIDDFFIGRNGEGDHALDFVSTDGHNTKMNALFDRVNTDTRSNYKVLKEFKIDLSAPNNRGPHNVADLRKQPGMIGGESGYVDAAAAAAADAGALHDAAMGGDGEDYNADADGDGNQDAQPPATHEDGNPDTAAAAGTAIGTDMRFHRTVGANDYQVFDGVRAQSKIIEFTLPFRRKLVYDDSADSQTLNTMVNEVGMKMLQRPGKTIIPINTDVFLMFVANVPGPHTKNTTHVSAAGDYSPYKFPLVRLDFTTELFFKDT